MLFATTGTVKKACSLDRFPYASVFNEDVKRYNAAAVEVMKRHDVPVTEIATAFDGKEETLIGDDAIHPNEAGVAVCANLVASAIKSAFGDASETAVKASDVTLTDVVTA